MEEATRKKIRDAEMILVGIGEEFAPEIPDPGGNRELSMYRKSRYCRELPADHQVISAYNRLRELIGGKPYFAVTLNTDDLIYRSDMEQDLIVAPCGSMAKLQCGTHLVDAAPFCDRALEAEEKGETPEPALCPVCGKPLSFHIKETEGYMEEGYLPQWQRYSRWLSCTLHRKLCILELGVGFQYPQVVRWPFEKTVYLNRKAYLIRVHSRLPQMDREISERGISVQENPVEWLLKE